MVLVALAASSAEASETFGGYDFYRGDPHVHTGVSGDGGSADLGDCGAGTCGDFATVFADGKAAGLDWMGVCDHTNGVPFPKASSTEYAALHALALAAYEPGTFVTIPSAEVWFELSTGGDLGHRTVMLFGENSDLASLTESDLQPTGVSNIQVDDCQEIADWLDDMDSTFGDTLAIPHHPAATKPMATDWTCHDDVHSPSVEIYSGHGLSLRDDLGYDDMWSGFAEAGLVTTAMDPDGTALELGFMGGSDSHDTRPGNVCTTDTKHVNHPYGGGETVIVLDEGATFDRDAVHDAIVDHRTYATTGPLVPVVQVWKSGGAELGRLGDEVAIPIGQEAEVTLSIAEDWLDYIESVSLVLPDADTDLTPDGLGNWSLTLGAGDVPYYAYIQVRIDGDSYYAGSCDDGGDDGTEYLWLSPSWFSEGSTDLDGDGVAYLDGDCHDGDASIYPGAVEVWYDGTDQDCDGNDADQDGDGADYGEDCDDTDGDVFPGGVEVWYDGVDQDCDGNDDDQDGDGFDVAIDCDDEDGTAFPGAVEQWYDGVDQDCDGNDDDQDGDGLGYDDDCDDEDDTVFPGATEVWYDGVDQDCDGRDDDQDYDGYDLADDCDDTDADVHPGAFDRALDGIDQDCDGMDKLPPTKARATVATSKAIPAR
jgi:hypothetical protein